MPTKLNKKKVDLAARVKASKFAPPQKAKPDPNPSPYAPSRFRAYDFTLPEVPEGESGVWSVKYFTIDPLTAMRETVAALNSDFPFRVDDGDYVKLSMKKDGVYTVVMSNTMMECMTHLKALKHGTGNVLINGLGLGMIAQTLALKKSVKRITIIEKSPDVIKLVAPYLHKKCTVIQGDAYKWTPPANEKYDFAWHDIWNTQSFDNLPQMARLHRKYAGIAAKQDSWFRAEMLEQREQERRETERYQKIAKARFG